MSSSKTDKSKIKETTFRNWAFASDFEIKVVDGIVVEELCMPCSSINEKKLKQKIAGRNLKLVSAIFYQIIFSSNDSPLKTEKCFLFHLKSFFCS